MFRFSIRELLLLTALIALALGWALDRSRLAQTNREMRTILNRLADTKAQLVLKRQQLQDEIEQVRSADKVP